jgi:tripartite-type tricarboxylate transporter receptor subunit TctC
LLRASTPSFFFFLSRVLRFAGAKAWMPGASPGMTVFVVITLFATAAQADPVEDFYRGKIINMIVGTGENAGAIESYPRNLIEIIAHYIPGRPTLIVRNMPGGAGVTAANYIYGVAPQDGTYWGFITRGFMMAPLLGIAQAKFEPPKFNWIGSTAREVSVGAVWNASTPVRSLEDAMRQEVIVGGTGLSNDTGFFPTLLDKLIGTRFKVIVGYKSVAEVELAMQKGEVQGKIGWTWGSLNSGPTADWLAEKKVSVIVQMGLAKSPRIPPTVPLALDYAKTQEDRQVMQLIFSPSEAGYPSFMGPGVPPERIAAIRKAFNQAVADPRFVELCQQQKLPLDPLTGEEVQKIVTGIYAMPETVIRRTRELMPAS